MPIAFAPFVGLALGGAFAWVAAPELARDEGPVALSRPFKVVVAFAALVWLPVVAYFVAFHGDWSYLYVVAWQTIPSALDLVLALLAGAAVVAGFGLSAGPARRQNFRPVAALIAAPATAVAAGVAAAAGRLAVSGTYAQFHGDFGTEPIGASSLGKGVLLMGLLLALAVAWTVRALARMSSEAR